MTRNTRPPFDPELEAVLAIVNAEVPAITPETIPALREAGNQMEAVEEMLRTAGVTRRDLTIPGYEGADLPVSVFARADHTEAGPGFYQIHGGGMIMGDRTTGMSHFLPWIVEHDAVVVAIEYRLAPEFPDPYPVEDCYAGLLGTAEHAAELGIDPDRLIISGASAGGGLAAGTALLARDRKGPELAGQVLIYPMLDDRDQSVSTAQYDGFGLWDRQSNLTGWNALLGERRGTEDVSIYAAPARATDLSGLPPAFIDCGSAEVFRDEDVAYATALWRSGVQAELHVWPGGFHGFDVAAPHTALARGMAAARNAWVARLLES
ncbi:Acetyl esterase/lipase [Saccharopolyspora antimicrobica]|uniref:Acetyl esterase/lipase n=1 Tax=Saccharopolyspora antimicrobica TaxID=455193 RepID=A0A1I4VJ87_9PSEU|nr:alpha/beta hydrolase [Saccharopolyspora antimicrobica]RKT86343.1 acetyl esterase/lipase [Saccharopolyspora antimicrobica]SFN01334.1 Acetyl esterase/lipase [Saccharopolyspora antimicrobica]